VTIDRERIAKLVGRLGSDADGERLAALDALGKALPSWNWLCDIVRGALPQPREKLFDRLVRAELNYVLAGSWALSAAEAEVARRAHTALDAGDASIEPIQEICDLAASLRRRARR